MNRAQAPQETDAIVWAIRTRDPDFADWAGFTAWLEADARHARAYDAAMAVDVALPVLLRAVPAMPQPDSADLPEAANDRGGWPARRWRWIGGGAIAAALAGIVGVAMMNRADIYSVSTRPGESRVIALDDGTRIDMNGGTLLRLDHNNPRFAALDTGEAAFTVRHDAADPFRVQVGDDLFEDAGTVFNIVASGRMTRIGVAEGRVIFNPQGEAITLDPGRALSTGEGGLTLTQVAPDAVAGWRQGRLSYQNAPVGEVADDIARTLGVAVGTSAGARAMRFTGTIRIDRDQQRFFAATAPLMGLVAERRGQGWLMKEKDGAAL